MCTYISRNFIDSHHSTFIKLCKFQDILDKVCSLLTFTLIRERKNFSIWTCYVDLIPLSSTFTAREKNQTRNNQPMNKTNPAHSMYIFSLEVVPDVGFDWIISSAGSSSGMVIVTSAGSLDVLDLVDSSGFSLVLDIISSTGSSHVLDTVASAGSSHVSDTVAGD
jgi:hypothetical protein